MDGCRRGLRFARARYQPGRPRVCQDMEPTHSNWPRIFRPLGKGFWPDVVWAVAVLAGVALGAWLFDSWDGFVGAIIGVTTVVVFRAVRRGVKRLRAPGPLA
jgi:hypothetical protein